MVTVENLVKNFEKNGINFYCGVPDSVLSKLILYLDKYKLKKHLICANEGGAVGLAIGNYLSSGKVSCVYMQNSGLGNAINPMNVFGNAMNVYGDVMNFFGSPMKFV